MGDSLPPKRQTVVDRLRRRMGLYRLHQGSCLPRYDQAANGIYDAQRHETMLLKQRFQESKSKKTKRTDNRHTPSRDNVNNLSNSNNDAKNGLVAQPKLKRAAGSPLLECAVDGIGDAHQNKIPRNTTPDHHNASNTNPSQQQSGMPSFSVQIVQQFTSSNTSQAPHSQTIQTNVTVQALSSGAIKTSNSPMTSSTVTATASPGKTSDMGNVLHSNNPGSVNNGSSTSISVGTNIECKREPDVNFAPCSMSGGSHPMNDLTSELPSAHNDNADTDGAGATNASSNPGANLGDRFSDSLANLGFPEDSSDDVIHPDILKDIIDDVFTNPSDLMNGFSFVDNMKDNSGNGNMCQNLTEGKDTLRMCNGKTPMQPQSQTQFQNANNPVVSQFSATQSQQAVFDFQSGGAGMNNNSSSLAGNNVTGTQSFGQNRMAPYNATAPNIPSISNNNSGLSLDFKLTEPSPAAQTLKQMAEQHQNMQQKQQMGLAMAAHPRSPFRSDSFTDPLSSIRSNFLNGASAAVNTLQKSPNSLFQNIPYNQQQNFSSSVKQEVGSPVPPMYTGMNTSSVQLSELELHKRRQQVLQMQQQQQQQQQQQPRPPFSQSPDQKPLGISGATTYPTSRPLTHYSDAMSAASHGSASNSPISHPGQFMRGVSTPGVTPPPNFSPSPSGTTLHLSQSQQLQISQSNQQLQVSQSQQQIMVSHDLKPTISPKPQPQQQQQQQQQQQHMQARNFYPGHHASSVQMSQSQSVSFQFGPGNGGSPNPVQRSQQSNVPNTAATQRQLHQYAANRQPPEYQSPIEANSVKHQMGQHLQMNSPDNRSGNQRGRKSVSSVVSSQGYVHVEQAAGAQSANSILLSGGNQTTSGRGRGARGNARANATSSKSAFPRHQRPPNVNVGPEGLNISQRPPVTTDWRHVYMQQQQQMNSNLHVRIPYSRAMPVSMGQTVSAPAPQYTCVQLDPTSNNNSNNALTCLSSSRDMMGNIMSQIGNSSSLTMSGGIPNSSASVGAHSLMQQQQQQAVVQCSGNVNTNMHNPQIQIPGNIQLRDPNSIQQQPQQQQQHGFGNSPKPIAKQLDDSSQGLSSDGNQFLLDFLDNIDCSTSDLLNFDVMHGGGSSFPLLDDMGMLGK